MHASHDLHSLSHDHDFFAHSDSPFSPAFTRATCSSRSPSNSHSSPLPIPFARDQQPDLVDVSPSWRCASTLHLVTHACIPYVLVLCSCIHSPLSANSPLWYSGLLCLFHPRCSMLLCMCSRISLHAAISDPTNPPGAQLIRHHHALFCFSEFFERGCPCCLHSFMTADNCFILSCALTTVLCSVMHGMSCLWVSSHVRHWHVLTGDACTALNVCMSLRDATHSCGLLLTCTQRKPFLYRWSAFGTPFG